MVRLQAKHGYDSPLGIVKGRSREPRSFIVSVNGKEYRRNRRHLLKVQKPHDDAKAEPEVKRRIQEKELSSPKTKSNITTTNTMYTTRYGRLVKRNPDICKL